MKKILIALLTMTIALNVNAQVREKVEKAMNEPQRKANEAKADARLIDKTAIYPTDSSKLNKAKCMRHQKDCTRTKKYGKKKNAKS